jgi:hypothetical protein
MPENSPTGEVDLGSRAYLQLSSASTSFGPPRIIVGTACSKSNETATRRVEVFAPGDRWEYLTGVGTESDPKLIQYNSGQNERHRIDRIHLKALQDLPYTSVITTTLSAAKRK